MYLVDFLNEHQNEIVDEAVFLFSQSENSICLKSGEDDIITQTKNIINILIRSLKTRSDLEFSNYITSIGQKSVYMGFTLSDLQILISAIYESILNCIEVKLKDFEEGTKYSKIIMKVIDKARIAIGDAFLEARDEIIARQQAALLELSTPVIPVFKEILIVPLIGPIDAARAKDFVESLLNGIVKDHAKVAILDATGVPLIDTNTGHHMIKAVRAARLLGCTCIIVGIRPVVAQTIVSLGVDFSKIITKQNLRQGLEYAFKYLGIELNYIKS